MGVAWEDQVGLAGHRRSGREGLHRSDLVDLDRVDLDRVASGLVGIRQAGQEEHRACAPRDRTFLRKDLVARKVRAVAKDRAARIRVVVSVGRESKGVLEVEDVAASADRAAREAPTSIRSWGWTTSASRSAAVCCRSPNTVSAICNSSGSSPSNTLIGIGSEPESRRTAN